MDQSTNLDRKVDSVKLGHIKANADGDFFGVAVEVSKVQPCLINLEFAVRVSLFRGPVPIGYKLYARGATDEIADLVQFPKKKGWVNALLCGEIQVVRKPSGSEISLSKAIASLQDQYRGKFAYAKDSSQEPAEDIVTLDVRGVDVELFGALDDFDSVDHKPSKAFCRASRRADSFTRIVRKLAPNPEGDPPSLRMLPFPPG